MQWLSEKGWALIYKTLHRKLEIEQLELHRKPGRTLAKVSSTCSADNTRHVTRNEHHALWKRTQTP